MDMNDGMPMPMGGNETMTPFMHFSMTDPLWFEAWVPMGAGATVGACIGLFFIAMIERLLNGMRGVMESWWRRK
jgi:copper transporter 1